MTKKKLIKKLFSLLLFLILFGYEYATGDVTLFTSHMKKSVALLNCISNPTEESRNIYHVFQVIDGDTLELLKDCKAITIRLKGINTPETLDPRKPVQCYGKEASNKAKEMLSNQKVFLQYDAMTDTYDKYGRTLGYIILPDGTNFNKYMIEQGFAYEYTYGNEHYDLQKEFKTIQEIAKTSERGLWSTSTCGGKL